MEKVEYLYYKSPQDINFSWWPKKTWENQVARMERNGIKWEYAEEDRAAQIKRIAAGLQLSEKS